MKAKEMAEKYKANPNIDTILELARQEVFSIKEIAETRHITTNSALLGILKELDNKWRVFARLCPNVNPEGFKILAHSVLPETKTFFP